MAEVQTPNCFPISAIEIPRTRTCNPLGHTQRPPAQKIDESIEGVVYNLVNQGTQFVYP